MDPWPYPRKLGALFAGDQHRSMIPPQKPSRRRRSRPRGPMPYRYDRRRPAWVPLSLVANGILLSWLGSSLVQPELYSQHQVQASTLGSSLFSGSLLRTDPNETFNDFSGDSLVGTPWEAIELKQRIAQSSSPSGVRLTYDQWVEQLQQEANAVALQKANNVSILAGDSLSLWFPEKLLPKDQIWLNQGISGETSQGLMRRLGLWKGLQPQRIFVMIGINDLLKGTASEQVLKNNQAIVRRLRQAHPKADIILQSVLPHRANKATWEGRAKLDRIPNQQILQFNRKLAAIAKAEKVHYLDLNPLFTNEQGLMRKELTTDGLHLNPQGYLVWSTAMNFFSLQELDSNRSTKAAAPANSPATPTAKPAAAIATGKTKATDQAQTAPAKPVVPANQTALSNPATTPKAAAPEATAETKSAE